MENAKKLKNPHFVCTGGCGLVLSKAGKCITVGCIRNRNPLTICRCKNGKHGDLPTKNVPGDMKGEKLPWKKA